MPCFLLLFSSASVIFTLRFCECRYPLWEAGLWLASAVMIVWMLATPAAEMSGHRALLFSVGSSIGFFAIGLMVFFAWCSRVTEQVILAVVQAVSLVVGLRDLLMYLGVLPGNIYYSSMTSTVRMVAIAAVLAWRYVRNANRVENFNAELRSEVEEAWAQLRVSFEGRHMIELTHARISERLTLVRDLHDGLGSTLIGGLAAIERAPEGASALYLAGVLREVRDDLRLIIDTSAYSGEGEGLAEQVIPLRHRMTRLLETQEIDCLWTLTGLEEVHLRSS